MTSARRLTYRFWWALAFRSVVPWATSDLAENGELCDSRWVDTKAAPVTAQWPLSMWFCVTKVPLFNRETRMVPQASLLMVQSLLPGAKHLWVQSWLLQRFRGNVLHWSSVAIKPQHQVGLHPSRGTDRDHSLLLHLSDHTWFFSFTPHHCLFHPERSCDILQRTLESSGEHPDPFRWNGVSAAWLPCQDLPCPCQRRTERWWCDTLLLLRPGEAFLRILTL